MKWFLFNFLIFKSTNIHELALWRVFPGRVKMGRQALGHQVGVVLLAYGIEVEEVVAMPGPLWLWNPSKA